MCSLCILLFGVIFQVFFFFSSRRRHTRYIGDWSSDVCSSDLNVADAKARNQILAQVATAQGAAGARGAALATAGMMSDDRQRAASIDELRGRPFGALGGGVQPDFESLIDLLTQTVAPQSWSEV